MLSFVGEEDGIFGVAMDNASYIIFYAIPSAPRENSVALNWRLFQKLPSLAVALDCGTGSSFLKAVRAWSL